MFMWPNSRISVMGGEQAASVLTQIKREAMTKSKSSHQWSPEEEESFRRTMLAKCVPLPLPLHPLALAHLIPCVCGTRRYDKEGHPYYASARLWDDGIIDPAETRNVLGLTLAACRNAPIPETQFGVFRM
jgi:3-methylcrotonyl-CoA carboxylase beta subunit